MSTPQSQPQTPPSARRYYATSAFLSAGVAVKALSLRPSGIRRAWAVVAAAQVRQAQLASSATAAMLREQEISQRPDALLNPPAFTTTVNRFEQMADATANDADFQRLVESIVQEAGRAAQQVATVTYPHVEYVRHLNLPSCSRCAVLAGRVYRFSDGFERHPGCDCVMIPVTVANDLMAYDPVQLALDGHVTGLSRDDRQRLHGATTKQFNALVNAKQRGLTRAGDAIGPLGRDPARLALEAKDRVAAIEALVRASYLRRAA